MNPGQFLLYYKRKVSIKKHYKICEQEGSFRPFHVYKELRTTSSEKLKIPYCRGVFKNKKRP